MNGTKRQKKAKELTKGRKMDHHNAGNDHQRY